MTRKPQLASVLIVLALLGVVCWYKLRPIGPAYEVSLRRVVFGMTQALTGVTKQGPVTNSEMSNEEAQRAIAKRIDQLAAVYDTAAVDMAKVSSSSESLDQLAVQYFKAGADDHRKWAELARVGSEEQFRWVVETDERELNRWKELTTEVEKIYGEQAWMRDRAKRMEERVKQLSEAIESKMGNQK